MFSIRPALATDQPTIRRMVRAAGLDPTSLYWRHFLIAEQEGQVVGIGQVKQYRGCRELGSLVVLPKYRGQGIAAALIEALEAGAGRPLYLLCEAGMQTYYSRFGYTAIGFRAAPAVLKLKLLLVLPFRLAGVRISVMYKP